MLTEQLTEKVDTWPFFMNKQLFGVNLIHATQA